VRGRKGPPGEGRSLEQYVNDRPYVASSFLSVAIAEVFGTALGGRISKVTPSGHVETVVRGLPSSQTSAAIGSLVSGVYRGPFANLQTFFAVSHDSASGRLVLEEDRVALAWPGAQDEPVYKRLDAALGALVKAAGGSYVKNPLAGTMMGRQPATAHPLGGCGMGRDRSEGVVNHKGQVFDGAASPADVHRGLYVMDGAVMPRSLGVNPLLTITALAERALLHLAQDSGLAFDDAPVRGAAPVPVTTPGAM